MAPLPGIPPSDANDFRPGAPLGISVFRGLQRSLKIGTVIFGFSGREQR
jgi:hypothetical protein